MKVDHDSVPTLPNAACVGTEPTADLCGRCWDRPECLAWALEHEDQGFWAGHGQAALNLLRKEFEIRVEPISCFDQYARAK